MGRIVRIPRRMIELHHLAHGLNVLRKGQTHDRESKRVWENVERIVLGVVEDKLPRKRRTILSDLMVGVGAPSLENAQRSFHWLSKQYPVELTIDLKRTQKGVLAVPGVRAHESHSGLGVAFLHILWEDFFGNRGYERLKTCQRCGDWFVDLGRNKKGVYCSTRCSSRWWNRNERRKAEHSQYTRPKRSTSRRR